ncbi:MAG TPA: CHRD domain-containing protein, partial [Saprospiraceae bacterium]|nr:CHRD domain-containing protein [Saprospiraceae bacterium]
INVHTTNNPSGEIRGQITLETDYRYTALMDGSQENPAVTTNGKGIAVFELTQNEQNVYFKVIFSGLTSVLTSAHIHNAPAGTNGSVIFDLQPFIHGNIIEGIWQPGAMLNELKAGNLYVNVHTANNLTGEIRGQLTLMQGLTFDLSLNGAQESPSVVTPGTGLGIVTVDPQLDQLSYFVVFDSLSGPATGAHFHFAEAGVSGPVVVDLTTTLNGNYLAGTAAPLNVAFVNALLSSGLYINIHTANHPAGEIRGQIQKFAREGYTFEMNGGQEVPPITTAATGSGLVSIDRDQISAHYMVVYTGLEGTFSASHFHNAPPGVSGGVIKALTANFNAFGGAYGYWDETSSPVFAHAPKFQNNEMYINVHSSTHPGGEIRGNIIRASGLFTDQPFDPGFGDNILLTAVLTGDNEVPAVTTDATALATLYFDADRTKAKINVTATGLSGPITGIHIHEGDPGTNGGVLFPLTNVGNRVQGEIDNIGQLDLISLLNSATYVNIHTEANPDGEIRGQLNAEQDYTFYAQMTGDGEVPAVTTNGRGLTSIHYTLGQLKLDINAQLTGLSSPITGAHLHAGAEGANGPVIIDLTSLINGNVIRGSVDLTIDELLNLFTGNVYINVHTMNNPAGEIRGQLNYLPGMTFDGWMSGLQENPFTNSAASGLAVATIYPGPNDIALWMLVDDATGPITNAHLHHATLTNNGPVVHDLSADLNNNGLIHLGMLDDGIFSSLLKGEIYINAHTAAYPGGELRGQLFRLARNGYGFDLCPEQETGTINAPNAKGSAAVSIDRLHSNVNINVVADGLTGDLTNSHIHQADIGVNGAVIADLTTFYQGTNHMSLYGATADTSIINPILGGHTYINVHTALHPAGEMRGQIVKDFLCSIETGIDPLSNLLADVQLSPVPVADRLQVTLDMVTASKLQMTIIDLTGRSLYSQSFDAYAGQNMTYLPTENLAPGFYALVLSDGRAAQAYKFVK